MTGASRGSEAGLAAPGQSKLLRVAYFTNIPSPYMVDRYNELADQGNLDLRVAFLQPREPGRSWIVDEATWRFDGVYVGTGARGVWRSIVWLVRVRPNVLITLYDRPEFLVALLLARALRIPVVIHVMKTFDTWFVRRRYKETAKRLLFPRVRIHSTGPDATAYAMRYGAQPNSVFELAEPVDVAHFATGASAARAKRLRVGEGVTFLYVGRLWVGKGVDYLLEAFKMLRRAGVDASLVLVGDGSDQRRFQEAAGDDDRIKFVGFVQQDRLPEYFGASDVLVFPTLGDPYGHVVQEAMAAGLPVIATSSAGDIRDRIVDGRTGFVVDPGDSASLMDAMFNIATDEELRTKMGHEGFEVIRDRTVGAWARDFARLAEWARSR